MALSDFQHALSEMTVNPVLAARVRRDGPPALAAYDLSPRELTRLVTVARHSGMDLNCTLARGNRFGPIVDVLPLTCTLLTPGLGELLNELWSINRPDNYQLAREEDAFAGFLQAKLTAGELSHPYLPEILGYELTCWSLIQTLRHAPLSDDSAPFRCFRFVHDPQQLLPPLQSGVHPPSDLPRGDFPVRITLRGDTLETDFDTI